MLAPASADASWYGANRFRAVEVRFEAEGIVAVVQAYIAEGTRTQADPSAPASDYELRFASAQVYTPGGSDREDGDGEVVIAWPLLEEASIHATIGSIEIHLEIEQRGALRLGPLAAIGLPPFAHVGVTGFRPGTATGSISSDVGSVEGSTTFVGLYALTSAYGVL